MKAAQRARVLEGLRYAVTIVLGLGVDLSLAMAAHRLLGLPLVAGAALGFAGGVVCNYLLFELWVFATRRLSWARLGQIGVAGLGVLAVRLGAVWALDRLGLPALLTLAVATGASFTLNFFLSRRIIVRR